MSSPRKKPSLLNAFTSQWVWRMAWRDTRASRLRLLLFSSAIILGIAALTALGSFSESLKRAMSDQAKTLLGADLVIQSRDDLQPEDETFLAQIGGETAREITFSSMIFFPKSENSRLVQIRAVESSFPFYGGFESEPAEGEMLFRAGEGALVDQALLAQYGAQPGDMVRVGELTLPVVGALRKAPGETVAFSTIAPRVYIPFDRIGETKLLRPESFARFKTYYKLPPTLDVEKFVEDLEPELKERRLSADTVEERKRDLGRSFERLDDFLNLGGFIALLLGGVGVASAISLHIRQKVSTVGLLRCLGATPAEAFAVYTLQAAGLGLFGAVAGGALGLVVQWLLPRALADFLALEVAFHIAWLRILFGMAVGALVCLLFAAIPLLSLWYISPLTVVRSGGSDLPLPARTRWLMYALLATFVLAFAIYQTGRWRYGASFTGALAVAFLVLLATARLLMTAARAALSPAWPYVIRQGVSNLFRPQNRTLLLVFALGLGTFLILTSYLTHRTLVTELIPHSNAARPNLVLFDIQTDQRSAVRNLLAEQNLPVVQEAAMIPMRLAAIKGETVEALLKSKNRDISGWPLRREYRSTYRDNLVDGEELVSGKWPASATLPDHTPISVEEGIARELRVKVGDQMTFDVQGIPIVGEIVSLRKVDWRRMQPNFFVVFAEGAIDDAPAIHVLATRVSTAEQSAQLQRAAVKAFPNISVIDLSLILKTVDAIVGKASSVIRFMALFTVVTGLIVLVGAIFSGRYQRLKESVLLRTLGASRSQVWKIQATEYATLGILSALAGILLAHAAGWALARFIFQIDFAPGIAASAATFVCVCAITIITGWASSRSAVTKPPLELLRAETS